MGGRIGKKRFLGPLGTADHIFTNIGGSPCFGGPPETLGLGGCGSILLAAINVSGGVSTPGGPCCCKLLHHGVRMGHWFV